MEEFKAIDTDDSNQIDKIELKHLLARATGSVPTDDELDAMLKDADTSETDRRAYARTCLSTRRACLRVVCEGNFPLRRRPRRAD